MICKLKSSLSSHFSLAVDRSPAQLRCWTKPVRALDPSHLLLPRPTEFLQGFQLHSTHLLALVFLAGRWLPRMLLLRPRHLPLASKTLPILLLPLLPTPTPRRRISKYMTRVRQLYSRPSRVFNVLAVVFLGQKKAIIISIR